MFHLHNLQSTKKNKKRRGRGGSRGGTSGRGHKGQRARSGGKKLGRDFEGGQMPLVRRLPKRGFNNYRFSVPVVVFNVNRLNDHFNDGDVVSLEALREKKMIKGKSIFRIKILGKEGLEKKLTIRVHAASVSAQEAIKKVGGVIEFIGGQ